MTSPCPACNGRREPGKYLCRDCWFSLSAEARSRLNRRGRRGAGATARYLALIDQINDRRPLDQIEIPE